MDDAKPTEDNVYLVFAPSANPKSPFIHTAWYCLRHERWEVIHHFWAGKITHWMPLPLPPSTP